MGAQIKGAGTDTIRITGVNKLNGGTYSIIPDQIEAGTFMIAAAATGGNVLVKNVIPKHMESLSSKLEEMGADVQEFDDSILVSRTKPLKKANVKTLPYPGFPTDLQPQIAALLSVANGTSIVTESVWDNRFQYVEELRRLGAKINVDGRVAIIEGAKSLTGATVKATDLRAGASMVIAALVANGVTLNTFFAVPDFTFLTAYKGIKDIDPSYISTLAVAYIPVAFVVFAEHIADHKNISSIIEKDLLVDPGLHRTLLGDGVGSIAGAIFGGCPNTTYGESVGCVAITKNASVITILTAAILAILISFVSPFIAFVNSIPSCVMGGVCMALYGFIAVSGLKMIQGVDLNQNKNLFVVSTILIAGIGGLSITLGKVTLTSIACALILGIIVNLIVSKADTQE